MARRQLIISTATIMVALVSLIVILLPPSEGQGATAANTNQFLPAVAYNEISKNFLVVWEDERDLARTSTNVYARVITGTDTTSAPPDLRLTDALSDQKRPRLTCNSLNGDCLVVWQDRRNAGSSDTDVWGQVVAADGSLKGSNFAIAEGAGKQHGPTVAFDNSLGRYLVTWFDFNGGTGGDCTGGQCDIRGQLVDADGSLLGSSFSISSAPNDQKRPVAAFNSTGNEFLVIWYDMRSGTAAEIYGQRVGQSGSLIGENVLLATGVENQYSPSVVYDPINNNFRILWYSLPTAPGSTQTTVFSTLVSPTDLSTGTRDTVSATGYFPTQPMIAYNSLGREFLGTWGDGRSYATSGVDIYAQRLSAEVGPVAAPTPAATVAVATISTATAPTIPAATETATATATVVATPTATATLTPSATGTATVTATVATAATSATSIMLASVEMGPNFSISSAVGRQEESAVAYGRDLDQYLVVWQDWRNGYSWIYGQMVSGSASLKGPNFPIPSVATSTPPGQGPVKISLPYLPKQNP